MEFQCNTFDNNWKDIHVSSGLIKRNQGNSSKGANNYFTNTKQKSIYNNGTSTINYYHSSGTNLAPIGTYGQVNVYNNAVANPCASTICTGGTQTKSASELLSDYEDLQETSNQLQADFQAAGYEQAIDNFYNNDVSVDAISDNVMTALNRIQDINNEMREISTYAVHSILIDSIFDTDLLKKWYEVIQTPVAKYSLAEAHAMLNDFDLADQVLQTIPEMFDYDEDQIREHRNYLVFHQFKKELYASERTWYELTEEEIAIMQNIAEATNGRSATMAKGVLCFFFNICPPDDELSEKAEYETRNTKGDTVGNAETRFIASQEEIAHNEISLFPNPTNGNLHIESSNTTINYIEIYDIMGKMVLSKEIHALSNKINISSLPNSIYLMKIYLNNGEIVIRKIVKN